PDVEELAEDEAPPRRRLDVDQAVGVARRERRPAASRRDAELPVAVVLRAERRPEADAGGDGPRLAVHEHRQMDVDVRDEPRIELALDAVDGLARPRPRHG